MGVVANCIMSLSLFLLIFAWPLSAALFVFAWIVYGAAYVTDGFASEPVNDQTASL